MILMHKPKGLYVPVNNLNLQEGTIERGYAVAWSGFVSVIKTDSTVEAEKERDFIFNSYEKMAASMN